MSYDHRTCPEDIVIEPQRLMNRARMSHGREAPWGSGGLAPGWGVQGGRQPPRVGSRKEHPWEAQGTSLRAFLEEPGLGCAWHKTPITLEPS